MNVLLVSLCILATFSCMQMNKIVTPNGAFFGITPSPIPTLLYPNFINTSLSEYNGTFSPEGTEFFYTSEFRNKGFITHTKMNEDGSWRPPSVATFSGTFSDYDPIFSPDGKRLYFTSMRPTKAGKVKSSIWYVEKEDNRWSEPHKIELTNKSEFYNSLTTNGDIYFNIWSTNNLFMATLDSDGNYHVSELDSTINGNYEKGDPFISPSGDYIIFRAIKENGFGRGDLYISYRYKNQWSKPQNLGKSINTAGQEMCPYVTTDGKLFIYASSTSPKKNNMSPSSPISDLLDVSNEVQNGKMNIFVISTDFIEALRPIE